MAGSAAPAGHARQRRSNSSKSMVLFGDRVSRSDLAAETGYGRVFALPSNFDRLFDAFAE